MVKRNIDFYERKKWIITKTWILHERKSSYYILNFSEIEDRPLFDSKSWCKMVFSSVWRTIFFECGKLLVLNFSKIENTVFFDLKSW